MLERPTQYGTNCCQMLLSNYRKTSHSGNMIALLFKSTKVSPLSRQSFPCPLQTTSHTKIIFLEWCLPVYLQVLKLFYLFDVFPSTVLVLSLFIEHIHIPQTYFRSKLTQPLQAPIPKHGVWYFTMLLLPTSLHSKNNFLECPNLVNIWLWITYSGNCVKYIHYLCFFC